jgi:hypothetical protein
MFGLDALPLAFLFLLVLAGEFFLFWIATALADVQPMSWAKFCSVVAMVTLPLVVILVVVANLAGILKNPLDPELRSVAYGVGAASLAIMFVIPALLYAPLLPVSFGRSVKISIYAVLLRSFLYVMVTAIVMIALATWQIWSGNDTRTEKSLPQVSHRV